MSLHVVHRVEHLIFVPHITLAFSVYYIAILVFATQFTSCIYCCFRKYFSPYPFTVLICIPTLTLSLTLTLTLNLIHTLNIILILNLTLILTIKFKIGGVWVEITHTHTHTHTHMHEYLCAPACIKRVTVSLGCDLNAVCLYEGHPARCLVDVANPVKCAIVALPRVSTSQNLNFTCVHYCEVP